MSMSPDTPTSSKRNTVKMDTPLDYSFMKLTVPADLLTENPRGMKEKGPDEKYSSKSIKLNNNHLQALPSLFDTLNRVVLRPIEITWIDLSFNELTHIDSVLTTFPNLQILYLHGNRIADLSEIDKLHSVSSLRKLALHGNPMENAAHYRLYVLQRLHQLINFDMSTITKGERVTASVIIKNQHEKKKRDSED